MRNPGVIVLFFLILCTTGCRSEITTPVGVLEAMQAEYAGDWYESVTFVQTTINYGPGGQTDTTSWWEALQLPGRLRIDIGGPDTGDTWIFRNDSIYVYQDGQLGAAEPTLHPLLLLGFDIYFTPLDEVTAKLDTLGFDLEDMHVTSWEGRDVYVIGAKEGDMGSPQFWIDKDRLVFVRLFQWTGPGGNVLQEIRFNNYEPLGGGWIAPEVLFYANSELTLKETYHEIDYGMELDLRLFDPGQWQQANHWFNQQVR